MSPPGRPKGELLSAQHEAAPVSPPGRPKGELPSAQHEDSAAGPSWSLQRDSHGSLVLTLADGTRIEGVLPVRAFPLSAPAEGLSLVGPDGRERLWVDHLDALPADTRALVDETLAAHEFAPEILQLQAVSTFSTPSTWQVDTDRGPTRFVLKGEEDIRRLADGSLLVTDSVGVGYRLRAPRALDRRSRRLLERFL